jgi:hypothetical protein
VDVLFIIANNWATAQIEALRSKLSERGIGTYLVDSLDAAKQLLAMSAEISIVVVDGVALSQAWNTTMRSGVLNFGPMVAELQTVAKRTILIIGVTENQQSLLRQARITEICCNGTMEATVLSQVGIK